MYIENWSWFCYCVLESAWLIASPVIPYTRRNLNSLLLWLAGRPSISSTDIGLFLSTDSVYHFPVLTSTLLHFPSDQLLSCFHLTRSITYLSLTSLESGFSHSWRAKNALSSSRSAIMTSCVDGVSPRTWAWIRMMSSQSSRLWLSIVDLSCCQKSGFVSPSSCSVGMASHILGMVMYILGGRALFG